MCEGSTTVKVLFYFLFVLQVLKYSHRFILQEVFVAHGKTNVAVSKSNLKSKL